jgi:hypothetical protein
MMSECNIPHKRNKTKQKENIKDDYREGSFARSKWQFIHSILWLSGETDVVAANGLFLSMILVEFKDAYFEWLQMNRYRPMSLPL